MSCGAPARPSRRTSWPAAASARLRAPAKQTIVAADPPLVSRPAPGACGKPTSSASQRTTVRSRWTSAWSPETTLGFIAAAASEAMTPAGEGGGFTQPKKAGWPLPMACGRTSRNAVETRSSRVAGCSGRGRPSSCSRSGTGTGCQTGPEGNAARWSATPSTSACAAVRNARRSSRATTASSQGVPFRPPVVSKQAGSEPAKIQLGGKAMTQHKVGTQEEWQAARDELLVEEKELTRRNDELTRRRRELPWVQVEKDYSFETADGTKSLAELFDGHSQLLIYHFMFGPDYTGGCPVCSSIADNLNPNAIHLAARDAKLMLVSRAPLEKLQGYRRRMGWSLDWASTVGSEFNRELGFLTTMEELKPFLEGGLPPAVEQNAEACGVDAATYVAEGPGLSAYILSDGAVYRTYLTTSRGLEPVMGYYGLLDRAPIGRNEEGEQVFWLRRHDEY